MIAVVASSSSTATGPSFSAARSSDRRRLRLRSRRFRSLLRLRLRRFRSRDRLRSRRLAKGGDTEAAAGLSSFRREPPTSHGPGMQGSSYLSCTASFDEGNESVSGVGTRLDPSSRPSSRRSLSPFVRPCRHAHPSPWSHASRSHLWGQGPTTPTHLSPHQVPRPQQNRLKRMTISPGRHEITAPSFEISTILCPHTTRHTLRSSPGGRHPPLGLKVHPILGRHFNSRLKARPGRAGQLGRLRRPPGLPLWCRTSRTSQATQPFGPSRSTRARCCGVPVEGSNRPSPRETYRAII